MVIPLVALVMVMVMMVGFGSLSAVGDGSVVQKVKGA